MESYIKYLLEDIAGAVREETATAGAIENWSHDSFEEYIEDVERYLDCNPSHPFSYFCGLGKEQFPPADQLNSLQMERICNAFERMLYSWNLDAELPDQLPVNRKYELMVSILDEKVEVIDQGITTIEFCNYDPPSCPFEGHCTCKDLYDTQDENYDIDQVSDQEDNPF